MPLQVDPVSNNLDEIRTQPRDSLEEFSQPHHLSPEAAVARLTQLIAQSHPIQFSEFVNRTLSKLLRSTSGEAFAVEGGPNPTQCVHYRPRTWL